MLFLGCWRWFDNIIWFSPSALILQQTVFEAGHTKLKMEKASLVFHLFDKKIWLLQEKYFFDILEDFVKASLVFHLFQKNILWRSWSGILLLQEKDFFEIMEDLERASLVFHLFKINYFLKIMEDLIFV